MNEWLELPQAPMAKKQTQTVYIRCSEVVAVEIDDVNLGNSNVILRNGREVATLLCPSDVMERIQERETRDSAAQNFPYYYTGGT